MKHCPLCHSQNRRLLYRSTLTRNKPATNQFLCTSNSYGIHGSVYRCSDCQFIFIVDKTPVRSILGSYEKAEDPLYVAEERGRQKTFARHLKAINELAPRGKLLDIGAYTGLFLSLAKSSHWRVSGIEPSKWAVIEAKRLYNINLKNGTLNPNYFRYGSFDVVTLWDVIEHFTDPLKATQICYSYLKPGGLIAMSTIDVESLAAKILGSKWPWFMRMHRVYFSRSTMRKMLSMAGFINIRFTPHLRIISLRYLISRLGHKSPFLASAGLKIISLFKLENSLITFYIGDLFDVYAQKPKS